MKLVGLSVLAYALVNFCLWPSKIAATIVSRTIDDQFGDFATGLRPIYFPPEGVWYNQTCGSPKCPVFPSAAQALEETYTAGTYQPAVGSMGISMQFNGTAIYVFFILANYGGDGLTTLTSANFTVDGDVPVPFTHTMNDTSASLFEYHALVFSKTNLPNTLHTLNITTTGSGSAYVNFDYAVYSYHDDVSTTPSPLYVSLPLLSSLSAATTTVTGALSSLSAATNTFRAPSTTVSGALARRTPVGAIVGGIVGGITLLALVISLLFCWRRRGGHGALQSVRRNKGPEPLITPFNGGEGSLTASASGMPYTGPLEVRSKSPIATVTVFGDTDNQANMRNRYRTLPSGKAVLSPPGSQQLPSSSKNALPSSTSNLSVFVTTGNNRSASPLLPTPLNVPGPREEVCRARQEDLDNQLRAVQNNIVQLVESSGSHGRSVSLRRQTSGEDGMIEEEMIMSVPDMQDVIRSMREQIRVLREQQQSAWAQGLSDDPPPGYTPMEVGIQISREAS